MQGSGITTTGATLLFGHKELGLTALTASLEYTELASIETVPVRVRTAAGTSNSLPFFVYRELPYYPRLSAWSPARERVYVITEDENLGFVQRLLRVNPRTGEVEKDYDVGGKPEFIAASADGRYLYIYLSDWAKIVRFNTATEAIDLSFYPAPGAGSLVNRKKIEKITVHPDDPELVFVYLPRSGIPNKEVQVFRSGEAQPGHPGEQLARLPFELAFINNVAYGADGSFLWKLDLGPESRGAEAIYTYSGNIWSPTGIFADRGRLLLSNGMVLSADGALIANLGAEGNYFVQGEKLFQSGLRVYDRTTLALMGHYPSPIPNGAQGTYFQWAPDGFGILPFLFRLPQELSVAPAGDLRLQVSPTSGTVTLDATPLAATFVVTNGGATAVEHVELTIDLPIPTTATSVITDEGYCVNEAFVRCQLGRLGPGESRNVAVQVGITRGNTTGITITGKASSDALESTPADNAATLRLTSLFGSTSLFLQPKLSDTLPRLIAPVEGRARVYMGGDNIGPSTQIEWNGRLLPSTWFSNQSLYADLQGSDLLPGKVRARLVANETNGKATPFIDIEVLPVTEVEGSVAVYDRYRHRFYVADREVFLTAPRSIHVINAENGSIVQQIQLGNIAAHHLAISENGEYLFYSTKQTDQNDRPTVVRRVNLNDLTISPDVINPATGVAAGLYVSVNRLMVVPGQPLGVLLETGLGKTEHWLGTTRLSIYPNGGFRVFGRDERELFSYGPDQWSITANGIEFIRTIGSGLLGESMMFRGGVLSDTGWAVDPYAPAFLGSIPAYYGVDSSVFDPLSGRAIYVSHGSLAIADTSTFREVSRHRHDPMFSSGANLMRYGKDGVAYLTVGGLVRWRTPLLAPTDYNLPAGVTRLEPASGALGGGSGTVTVYGVDFLPESVVYWNDDPRTTEWVSSTQLRFALASDDMLRGGRNRVAVMNPAPGGGPSNVLYFLVSTPTPALARALPNASPEKSPGSDVDLEGANFTADARVFWNDSPLYTSFVDAGRLRATIPETLLATPGTYHLTVKDPSSGNIASPPVEFSVTARPLLGFSVSNLTFPYTPPGTSSTPRYLQLTNRGSAAATGLRIATTGRFGFTTDCGTTLGGGQSCNLEIAFTPEMAGEHLGTLNVTGDQLSIELPLAGFGAAPHADLQGSGEFGTVTIFGSITRSFVLQNNGTMAFTITSIEVQEPFKIEHNYCSTGRPVYPPSGCVIVVGIRPETLGQQSGRLTVRFDSLPTAEIELRATATDISISLGRLRRPSRPGSAAQVTVQPGETAAVPLLVTGGPGFNRSLKFECTTSDPRLSCVLRPGQLDVKEGTPQELEAMLTFRPAPARTAAGLGILLLIGMVVTQTRRRGKAAVVLAVVAILWMVSCAPVTVPATQRSQAAVVVSTTIERTVRQFAFRVELERE